MSQPDISAVNAVFEAFRRERLIGIVRTADAESALWTATQLLEAGVRLIEVPYTVPEAGSVIETLCARFPDAVIGAGTVLEARAALDALGAGARFLVSPVLVEPLIQFGAEQDIPVLPGCFTPTEIYHAYSLGAPAVKFFPAQCAGGAEFIRAVHGPLPQIPIVPTGGIQLEHVTGYLRAGALAVGVGGPMVPQTLIQSRDADKLQTLAAAYLDAVRQASGA